MITFTQLKNLFRSPAQARPVLPKPTAPPLPAKRLQPRVRLTRMAQAHESRIILPAGIEGRILEYGVGFVLVSFPGVTARLPVDSQLIEGVESHKGTL